MQRAARAIFFSGSFVGAIIFGHRWSKRDELNELELPPPLPELNGNTNDELLADTVNRYSRMAPVYDGLLDKVEDKYNGFELRKKLISQANGNVLEIGVGTARNIPFYDNNKVNTITYVDSTYPMINSALVKVNDLYQLYHYDSALVTANETFEFEIKPTQHYEEAIIDSTLYFQQQYETVLHNNNTNDQSNTENNTNTHTHSNITDNSNNRNHINSIIHTTYRPQIVFPINPLDTTTNTTPLTSSSPTTTTSTTTPTTPTTIIETTFPSILSKFPLPIQQLFSYRDTLSFQTMSNISIQDDNQNEIDILYENINDTTSKPTSSPLTPATTATTASLSSQSRQLPDGTTPSRQQRQKVEKLTQKIIEKQQKGQKWRTLSSISNIIPSAFIHLDCHDLSFFPSNSYDTIVDTFGLCSFHHPIDVLSEIRRICKPGGKILLLEHGLGTNFVINQVIKATNDTHKKQWGCDRSKDIVQLLQDAGYDVQYIQRHHGGSTVVWNGTPKKTGLELQQSNDNNSSKTMICRRNKINTETIAIQTDEPSTILPTSLL